MRELSAPLLRTIKGLASDRRVRSGFLWNLLSTIAGRSSGLITSVVLSRMLGKEGFGEFSIIQNTILTIGIFAGFGAGLTATKHIAETFRTDPRRADRIMALVTVLAVFFGSIMTLALLFGAPLIATKFLSSSQLTALLRLASFSLIASALSGAQNGILAGFEAFRAISSVNIFSGVINIVLVSLGVYIDGITGAMWGYNIAILLSCCLGWRALRIASKDKGIFPDYRNCITELSVLWNYSLPTMIAYTLVVPTTWLCNALLVRQPGGMSEMATYNVVTQWRQVMLFLPSIATQVFLPIMASQTHKDGQDGAKKQYAKFNLLIALPFLVVLSVLSPLIMSLYGKDYTKEWPVFIIVQFATLLQILQTPATTAWVADGRMWANVVANSFWGGVLILLSWLLISWGALGLATALFLTFLLYFLVIYIVNNQGVSKPA